MSKLVPLLEEGTDDLERQLLESGRDDDGPDDAARARTLAAAKAALQAGALVGAVEVGVLGWRWATNIGLTTGRAIWLSGVVSVLVAGSASLVSTPAPDSRSTSTPRASVAATPVPPVVNAGTTTTAPPVDRRPSGPSSPKAMESAAPLPMTPPHGMASSPARAAENALPVEPLPATDDNATVSPTSPALAGSGAAGAAPSPDLGASEPAPGTKPRGAAAHSLAAELALVQAANAALAASQPTIALARLDSYDAQFPAGVLAQEAKLLRVEALLAAGRRVEAGRVADAFERQFPASSFLPRIRRLVSATNP